MRRNRLNANIEVQNRLLQEALFKPYDPQYFKYVQGMIEETVFAQETRKLQEAHEKEERERIHQERFNPYEQVTLAKKIDQLDLLQSKNQNRIKPLTQARLAADNKLFAKAPQLDFYIDKVLEQSNTKQGLVPNTYKDQKFKNDLIIYDYLDKTDFQACRELSGKEKSQ